MRELHSSIINQTTEIIQQDSGTLIAVIILVAKSETTCALIMGKRNKKISKLESVLTGYFSEITIISGMKGIDRLSQNYHFHLIVVTDSLTEEINKENLLTIKGLFPNARLLCLCNQLTQEVEIALRSVGLIFLGSYEHFNKIAHHILRELLISSYEVKK